MRQASEAQIVTVALRRVDVEAPEDSFLTLINPTDFVFLSNTSGARDADEAIECYIVVLKRI